MHRFLIKEYILTIVDTFTRWIELFHTTDNSAASTGKCPFRYFGRFGVPAQILSDNGKYFTPDKIAQYFAIVSISIHAYSICIYYPRMSGDSAVNGPFVKSARKYRRWIENHPPKLSCRV